MEVDSRVESTVRSSSQQQNRKRTVEDNEAIVNLDEIILLAEKLIELAKRAEDGAIAKSELDSKIRKVSQQRREKVDQEEQKTLHVVHGRQVLSTQIGRVRPREIRVHATRPVQRPSSATARPFSTPGMNTATRQGPRDESGTHNTRRIRRTVVSQVRGLSGVATDQTTTGTASRVATTATTAAAFQELHRRGSRRSSTRTVANADRSRSTLMNDTGRFSLHAAVDDNYLDSLIQRHAPTLSQQPELTMPYRPRFMTVNNWTNLLTRADNMMNNHQAMQDYLRAVMDPSNTEGLPKRKGLSKKELLSLSSFPVQHEVESPCCICLDQIDIGQHLLLLPCSHGYHRSCIEKWLSSCASCPLCKCEVKPFPT